MMSITPHYNAHSQHIGVSAQFPKYDTPPMTPKTEDKKNLLISTLCMEKLHDKTNLSFELILVLLY